MNQHSKVNLNDLENDSILLKTGNSTLNKINLQIFNDEEFYTHSENSTPIFWKEDYIFDREIIDNILEKTEKDNKQDPALNTNSECKKDINDKIVQNNSKEIFFNINHSLTTQSEVVNKKENKNNSSIETLLNQSNINNDEKKKKQYKYTYDNTTKRCKTLVLHYVREFINEKLAKRFENKSRKRIKRKVLLEQKRKREYESIEYKRSFMKKKLKDIFSGDISSKYKKFQEPKMNENLIQELIQDKEDNYFSKIFNLNFIDCLDHFIENKKVDELEGLKLFSQIIEDPVELKKRKIKNDKVYLEHLRNQLKSYGENLEEKKSRIGRIKK